MAGLLALLVALGAAAFWGSGPPGAPVAADIGAGGPPGHAADYNSGGPPGHADPVSLGGNGPPG